MKDGNFGIFSFASSHYAMAAEQAASQIPEARLIPLPPEISAGCGLALRVDETNIQKAIAFLAEHQIPFEELKRLQIKMRKRIISEI